MWTHLFNHIIDKKMSFRRIKGGVCVPEMRRNLLLPAFTVIVVEPDVEDFSFAPSLNPSLLYRNDNSLKRCPHDSSREAILKIFSSVITMAQTNLRLKPVLSYSV